MKHVVYENGAAHVIQEGPGYYSVWQKNGTASYLKGSYDFKSDPSRHGYALTRAKTRADELKDEPGVRPHHKVI